MSFELSSESSRVRYGSMSSACNAFYAEGRGRRVTETARSTNVGLLNNDGNKWCAENADRGTESGRLAAAECAVFVRYFRQFPRKTECIMELNWVLKLHRSATGLVGPINAAGVDLGWRMFFRPEFQSPSPELRNLWNSCKFNDFCSGIEGQYGSTMRIDSAFKGVWFAWNACIKHAINERASAATRALAWTSLRSPLVPSS